MCHISPVWWAKWEKPGTHQKLLNSQRNEPMQFLNHNLFVCLLLNADRLLTVNRNTVFRIIRIAVIWIQHSLAIWWIPDQVIYPIVDNSLRFPRMNMNNMSILHFWIEQNFVNHVNRWLPHPIECLALHTRHQHYMDQRTVFHRALAAPDLDHAHAIN